ncbi:MAG TPA: hypothetical protein PKY82_27060, partial [Pyrinomonadaceae bacterium]|nr:hypothetical protein [Pyrinomonadaceae bacterium]
PVITTTSTANAPQNQNDKIPVTTSSNFQQTTPPINQQFKTPHKLETLDEFKQNPEYLNLVENDKQNNCLLHEDEPAKFLCETCSNYFCKECPKSYGEKVKFCPMCGAMLKPIVETKKAEKIEIAQTYKQELFGFKDFGRAFTYPLRFKISFLFGAFLYMICTVSQNAASLGGRWLITAGIMSGMLGNTLTFGILSNMVENMLQGKLTENFMPNFDDFSIWDDVVQPFFLSIGVYISSFAGLIVLVVVMFFVVVNTINSNSELMRDGSVKAFTPELSENYSDSQNTPEQLQFFKEAVKKQNEDSARKMQGIEQSENNPPYPTVVDEEKEFQQVNEMIQQNRKKQIESTIGQLEEPKEHFYGEMFKNITGWAKPFILIALIFTLWGFFYLPVAYIVAAYTRNFGSLFNPFVGLDTIKRLGFDYVKILLMSVVLLIFSGVINAIIKLILAPFDLPRLGNLPAQAIGSFITFYLSIVFSAILGYALFKNSDKFQIYQNN